MSVSCYPRGIKLRQYGSSRKSPRCRDENPTTTPASVRRVDRRRQCLAADRKRAFRRSRKIRRGQRAPHLWGFLESAAQVLDRMLQKYAIDPYQQFAYTTGKNASDIALVIDAMDLLHSGRFDGFCLVSSDSDFTRLASRLREQGADVYGFGAQKTPESFRQACRRYIYTENLLPQTPTSNSSAMPKAKSLQPPSAALPILIKKGHCTGRKRRRRLGKPRRRRKAIDEPGFGFRSAHLWLPEIKRPRAKHRHVRIRENRGQPHPHPRQATAKRERQENGKKKVTSTSAEARERRRAAVAVSIKPGLVVP
jgi:hypothetical protein